jgi:hypothetical protein
MDCSWFFLRFTDCQDCSGPFKGKQSEMISQEPLRDTQRGGRIAQRSFRDTRRERIASGFFRGTLNETIAREFFKGTQSKTIVKCFSLNVTKNLTFVKNE